MLKENNRLWSETLWQACDVIAEMWLQILHGLTLRIPATSTVAIVGGSGWGKSTIMQLLQRLYTPNNGKVSRCNEKQEFPQGWF